MAKRGRKSKALVERFWTKVDKRGPDECWSWLAYVGEKGYGQIKADGNRKMLRAHRVSWELNIGPIPDGLCVCHHCDNPPCVNPAHLFVGTYGDNNRDAYRKGRKVPPTPDNRGELNGQAKLTEAHVHKILVSTETQRGLAYRHNVSWRQLGRIR